MEPTAYIQSERSPAPSSPPKTHESIWKRSKKILGVSGFEFLQKNYANSPGDKSPKEGDAEGGESAASKRREQVRRAQKKHRARTDAYIKALEQEVVRLQKVEAQSTKLNTRFLHEQSYIRRLEKQVNLLQKGGDPNSQRLQGQQEAYQVGMGDQVGRADTAMISVEKQNGQYALAAQLLFSNTTSPGGMRDTDFGLQNGPHWQNLELINPIANYQMAIDFILRLEEPCMAHLHAQMANPAFSGHVLTASSCLISQSPSPAPVNAPSSWNALHVGIEHLFYLSSKLNLSGEITPAEAWNRIWLHPLASGLTAEGLGALEMSLKELISCYGFGAVIDESKFSTVLDTIFKDLASQSWLVYGKARGDKRGGGENTTSVEG